MILHPMKENKLKSQARPGSFLYGVLAASFLLAVIVFTALKAYHAAPYLSLNAANAASFASGGDYKIMMESSAAQTRKLRHNISADIKALHEASGEDVRILFGKPHLVMSDLPTTIWQYRSEGCALNVYFLHSNGDVLNVPVAHYDIQPRGEAMKTDNCARDIMKVKSGTGFMNVSTTGSRRLND